MAGCEYRRTFVDKQLGSVCPRHKARLGLCP